MFHALLFALRPNCASRQGVGVYSRTEPSGFPRHETDKHFRDKDIMTAHGTTASASSTSVPVSPGRTPAPDAPVSGPAGPNSSGAGNPGAAGRKPAIGFLGLVALIVSSAIGTGIFGVMSQLAQVASPGPAFIAWIFTDIGFAALIIASNNLARKRPDLTSGMFSYAGESFGRFGEFLSGWGYWVSDWLTNIAFCTMLMSAVGTFVPAFAGGQNLPSILASAALIWALTLLIARGVESASVVNTIVTVCKLVPILVFGVAAVLGFKAGLFTSQFWATLSSNAAAAAHTPISAGAVFGQAKNSLLVTVWLMLGIEGAFVMSNRARRKSDAIHATVAAFVCLALVYLFISLLPYGVMTRAQLAGLGQPAMGAVMGKLVGGWGEAFINIALIVSCLGGLLSWTILPTEATTLMARDHVMPAYWGRLNARRAPQTSLVITAAIETAFLLTFLITSNAYDFCSELDVSASLVCYLFICVYQIQYSSRHREGWQLAVGIVAAAFQLVALVLAGWQYTLLIMILYTAGFGFYIAASRGSGRRIGAGEWTAMGVIAALAAVAVVLTCRGVISV